MVTLNSGTVIASSQTVGAAHFGLNYLLHLDGGTTETNAFTNIASNLHGTSSVRFPGGTIAEVETGGEGPLDISVTNGALAGTTLAFLDSAAANNWSATFVLPMWRFLDVTTMTVGSNGTTEIVAYVEAVITAARTRGVTIDGFELGNEWDNLSERTNGADNLTRLEHEAFSTLYAEFAADLAVVVQGEINESGFYTNETEPFIAIQALNAWRNNNWNIANDYEDALRNSFTDGSGNTNAAGNAVDAVISHFYLTQPGGGAEVRDPSETFHFGNMEDVSDLFGGNLDYLISNGTFKPTYQAYLNLGFPKTMKRMGNPP